MSNWFGGVKFRVASKYSNHYYETKGNLPILADINSTSHELLSQISVDNTTTPSGDIINPPFENPSLSFSLEARQENLKYYKHLRRIKEWNAITRAIQSEPENSDMVYGNREVKTIFQQARWMEYFDKMKKGNVVVEMEFVRTFNSSTVEV